ncbi:MAG: hypothetical protein IT219_03330 [Bacteroidales bacterium]|nr:hypothetical protein [Bacteroidales bacterium]
MKIYLLFILLLLSGFAVRAQSHRTLLETKEEIVAQATKELDSAMLAPHGELYLFGQKQKISGEYTLQLTMREKGQVVSVFVMDKKEGNIPSQNSLKDRILNFRFSFKMPKKKDYKFTYSFKF